MSDDGPGRRELAHRVFAAEYDDATHSHTEGEEERAPTYVVTPSGAKANRLFFVGVLTELERVNDEMVRARVVDPTGAFVVYAGQYQPEARAAFERADTPSFLAVAGKARTFQPEDGDRIYSSVRPESVNAVDADTRDRWVVQAAERTLGRVAATARRLRDGGDRTGTDGVSLALGAYDTSPAYLGALREVAVDAVEVVADRRDEVRPLDLDPSAPGEADLAALATLDETAVVPSLGLDDVGRDRPTATADAAGDGTGPGEGVAADDTATLDDDDGDATAGETTGSATETTADTPGGADSDDADDAGGEPVAATADDPGEEPVAATADPTGESETTTGGTVETEPDEGLDGAVDDDRLGDSTDDDGLGDFEPGGLGEDGASEAADEGGLDDSGDDDGLGDFEPGDLGGDDAADEGDAGSTADDSEATDDALDAGSEAAETAASDLDAAASGGDPGPNTDEMYELDEAERAEIESEFDTGFSTGTEVDAPGEADIETPAPEDDPGAGEAGDESEPEPEPGETGVPDADDEPDGPGAEPGEAEGSEAVESETDDQETADDEDVDLESVLLERMADLDDGDGADREELLAAVVDETGADPGAVEDAVEEALMGGQCYEPGDGRLKPI
jgi:RPA family protein